MEEICEEKKQLVHENRELKKQLNEAMDEIDEWKAQCEQMHAGLQIRESELEVQR